MTNTDSSLLVDVRDHVAWVVLNRPERLNALNNGLKHEITQKMSELSEDSEVSVVVITGSGDRAFCVGADLNEIDSTAREGRQLQTPMTGLYRNVFESVLEVAKPTIAALHGYVLAGGFELALACDLRVAADNAVFGMPEAKIGMGANFASVLLPRLVPRAAAYEILYTGNRFDVHRARELGLVNQVVARDELDESVRALATNIAGNAPLSLQRYKAMFLKGWELSVPQALRLNAGPNPYTSQDRAEGVRAFVEKRRPRWQGR